MAACGTDHQPLICQAVHVTWDFFLLTWILRHPSTHTDLSSVFHCRKRSKYMLSKYWMKGSSLRYLCRSLILNTRHLVFLNIFCIKSDRTVNLLFAANKDVVTGTLLQRVSADAFILCYDGHTLTGLKKHE